MTTRREFIALTGLVASASLLDKAAATTISPIIAEGHGNEDLTQFVNVFCGTGGHGHCFPGATVPFGAVQLSPDTGFTGWDWCSGYHHDDTVLIGFSHTHLSGTGASDMLDLLLAPRTGDVVLNRGNDSDARQNPAGTYRSRFSHEDEHASPGYYSVLTEAGAGKKIRTELTATERTGLAKFTFPAGEPAHILLDWQHGYGDPQSVKSAELEIVDGRTIAGGRHVSNWSPDREIHFVSEFSEAPTKIELFSDDKPVNQTKVSGTNLKMALHFQPGATVLVKSGISMVSTANARENLRAEQPGFNFDGVRAKAQRMWQTELARVRIEDPNLERKKTLYSAMYHMMCAPTLADDVNRQYRGLDKKVHTLAEGEHNYSTYSLWDTYRALHPSFTLWQRDRVTPMVNCLVRTAEESIYGFPIWPLQDGETYCMPGYHAASVMAEACVKKIPGIDWKRAYAAMRKRNMEDNYMGLPYFRKLGYIPADKEDESVGKFVEYIYCEWACANVAMATGNLDDARIQRQRSQNYTHLFDTQVQFLRPKLSNGEWAPDFDPRATGHVPHHRDYTEANAWQSTFFIQHDVKGYMKLFGGREAFAKKLDGLFTAQPGVSNEQVSDMTGFIGQYVHGNEPSHHIAFLYIWAGQPWKTQERVREILLEHYRNDYDGLDGNEDCGQMSAWFFMSALGLYAVDPVSATYVLSAPLFETAVVQLGGGRELKVEARRNSPEDRYIQAVTLNGQPLDKLWVRYQDLEKGAHLIFTLGPQPNKGFAVNETVMPPSLTA